ncbi:MAG: Lrp/AsnC family transcriptional regulator [Candidatus Nanoarchaeia archaeon]
MKLKKLDEKILHVLDGNARKTFSQISRDVGLSKERVRYRIRAFEDDNFLLSSYAIVDYSKLSLQMYKVYLKLQHTTVKNEKKLIQFIKKELSLVTIIRCDGVFEIVFLTLCDHPIKLYDMFMKLKSEFGSILLRKEIHPVVYFHRSIFRTHKKSIVFFGNSKPCKKYPLTPLKKHLLQKLSVNARTSAVDLSKDVYRSAKNVAENIKHLERDGFIVGYGVHINLIQLGWVKVILNISLQDGSASERIMSYFQKKGILRFSHLLTGFYDLSLELWVEDLVEYRLALLNFKKHFSSFYSFYDVLFVLEEDFIGFRPYFDE